MVVLNNNMLSLQCNIGPPIWVNYKYTKYTLPETNIAMEYPRFWWYLPGKMGIFMGYVSLLEGKIHEPQIVTDHFLVSFTSATFLDLLEKMLGQKLRYPLVN